MDQSVLDLDLGGDSNFEPQQRARSNTWPLPRPDNYVDVDVKEEDVSGGDVSGGGCAVAAVALHGDPCTALMMGAVNSGAMLSLNGIDVDGVGKLSVGGACVSGGGGVAPKKNSSRRNAWGNMSYADLITQAIQSCVDKRLTLSQIYDWMVHNVPYFKDKGDSNSSAGWKNSIRHNLSLHNRFMRVQNEGTGKSSWWMINPDAKPGKSARRRATSMETSKYEKKRGRVKKKMEALRAGLTTTPSPSSSVSEGLDMFPESPQLTGHPLSSGGGGGGANGAGSNSVGGVGSVGGFQLSPGDYRPRASSNASSIGRLSPIPAVESELHDHSGWSPDYPSGLYHAGLPSQSQDRFNADHLVDNMAESMKIRDSVASVATAFGDLPHMTSSNGYSLCPHPRSLLQSSQASQASQQQAPPSYSPQATARDFRSMTGLRPLALPLSLALPLTLPTPPSGAAPSGGGGRPTPDLQSPAPPPYTLANMQGLSPSELSPPGHGYATAEGSNCSSRSSSRGLSGTTSGIISLSTSNSLLVNGYRFSGSSSSGSNGGSGGSGLLRAALAHGLNNSAASSASDSGTPTPSQMMSQLMGALNNNGPMPNDLDLNLDSLHGGFDCNVDEVIKHELSMDGSLDFNFSQHQQQLLHQQQQQQQQHQQHQQHQHQQHQQQQHLHQLQQHHLHHVHHHVHPQPVTSADFNLTGFGASTANVATLPASSTSQPPPLCSLAALAPGRSWVR